MTHPRLSILMPVYNGERYLRAALDSVIAQDFRDFEFVVIDDGSTDSSPHILKQCHDPRLKVHRIPHSGLIGALNEGLVRCAGSYVARMDADDLSYPGRLSRQVEFLDTHPHVGVVTCECELLDEAGRVVGRKSGGVGDDMILELAAGNHIVHGSVMVRRAALPPAPVYPRPPEDYWLWVTMVRAGHRFHCLPEVLYGFRTHDERYSLTHAQSQSAGIVEVQWPLLQECMATRNLKEPSVRSQLARGWGSVAGAAYRSGDRQRADQARRRLLELVRGHWEPELAAAADHGIEAIVWGGCPWRYVWSLRWLQWRHRPAAWSSYRNLLLALPPVRKLRAVLRGSSSMNL